jgi:hypothetical protein
LDIHSKGSGLVVKITKLKKIEEGNVKKRNCSRRMTKER